MDTGFYTSLGTYEFDVRCEMLAELGFDATYLTLWSDSAWADVPRLRDVKSRHGLDVAAVYTVVDLAQDDRDPEHRRVLDLMRNLEGTRFVEVAIRSSEVGLQKSDPAGDARAIALLESLLSAGEERGIVLALYPHINFWQERVADALRLWEAIRHPRLKLVFPTYHWYAVDGTGLQTTLSAAAPALVLANICGSRRFNNGSGLPATIEPLDEGELDPFAVLGTLQTLGYSGPIGVQGYSVGGDVYTKLQRSLSVLRSIEQRLATHPRWAELQPPRS